MKTPGITVRPLVLLNGHRHFNEVFFEDVAVPKENLVGPLNEGWKVAITTLMFERSGAGGRDHAAQIARLAELTKQFRTRQAPAWHESHIRQHLAQLAIDVKALQVTRLRGLTRRLRRGAGSGRLDPQTFSLFLVPKDAAGLSVSILPTMDETRKLCEVRLDNVALPGARYWAKYIGGGRRCREWSAARPWHWPLKCAAAHNRYST